MTDEDNYNKICKHQFHLINSQLTELKHDTEAILQVYYKGNGRPPVLVQLDRLNRFMKATIWVTCSFIVILAGVLAKLAWL